MIAILSLRTTKDQGEGQHPCPTMLWQSGSTESIAVSKDYFQPCCWDSETAIYCCKRTFCFFL